MCLELFFPPIDIQQALIQHTQCPCRFVILATKALQSQASRQTYIYIANATRYQVHTRYTHACGVWVVFLEHGGGALGIFKSPVCTYLRSNHGPLSASRFLGMWHSSCYCMRHSWLTKFGVICLNQLVLFVGARFLMGNFPRKSSSTKWRTLRLLCAAKSQEG